MSRRADNIRTKVFMIIFLAVKSTICSSLLAASNAFPLRVRSRTVIWAASDLIRRIVVLRPIVTSLRSYNSSVSAYWTAKLSHKKAFKSSFNQAKFWASISIFNICIVTLFVYIQYRVRANSSWSNCERVVTLNCNSGLTPGGNWPVLIDTQSIKNTEIRCNWQWFEIISSCWNTFIYRLITGVSKGLQ